MGKGIKILWLVGMLAVVSPGALAQYGPGNMNFDGKLVDASDAPITNASVTFKFELMDKNATCVLYSELHSGVNLSATAGAFSLKIGNGSSATNYLMGTSSFSNDLFFNSGGASGPFTGCAGGVTMNPGDGRQLRVSYDIGGGLVVLTPNYQLSSVPNAMVADTLQGKAAADFIQVKDDVGTDLNQTNVESVFSATNFAKLIQMLNGTFSAAYSFNNQRVSNVGAPTAAGDAANKGYADGYIGGQVADVTGVGPGVGNGATLIWDQAQNKWVTGTPSVTFPVISVAGKIGAVTLNTADISGLGTAATKNFGAAAGNLLELDGGAKIPSGVLPPTVVVHGGNSPSGILSIGSNDSSNVEIKTNNVARMTIDSANGRVGIGTSAPISAVHIHKAGYNDLLMSSNTDSSQILLTGSPGSSYPGVSMAHVSGKLQFTKVTNGSSSSYPWISADGASGIFNFTAITGTSTELKMSLQRGNGLAAVTGGTPLARLSFDGHNSVGYSNSAAAIQGVAAENFGSTVNGTDLLFLTTNNGTNTPAERMRIANNGNVGIGITTPSASLHVDGPNGFAVGTAFSGSAVMNMKICSVASSGGATISGNTGNGTLSCPGVPVGAVVQCSPHVIPSGVPVTWSALVDTAGQVTIRFLSTSGTGSVGVANWKCVVMN